jgi:hypothetical protein
MKEHAQLITHVLFCVNHTNKSKIIDRHVKQHKKLRKCLKSVAIFSGISISDNGKIYPIFDIKIMDIFCRLRYNITNKYIAEVVFMEYISVIMAAQKWDLSERSVRNYCSEGRIAGAILGGKSWKIPIDAVKPARKQRVGEISNDLLTRLKLEKESGISGGIYHKVQIELTYNSNHMEGSKLTHDQTRYIFETNTIGVQDKAVNVDDIVETANHFKCIDLVIDLANYPLSEAFIKQLHMILKSGTSDSRKAWFVVGDYKRMENEVSGNATTKPCDVQNQLKHIYYILNRNPCLHSKQSSVVLHGVSPSMWNHWGFSNFKCNVLQSCSVIL